MKFSTLSIAAFVWSTAISSPSEAASNCDGIPAEYQACMAEGQRAYNMTSLGNGDFSFIEKCKQQRDQATANLCRSSAQVSRELSSEQKVFRDATYPNLVQRYGDHVAGFLAAQCTLVNDSEGRTLLVSGHGNVICPTSPGDWASCTGNGPFSCVVDPSEVKRIRDHEAGR